MTTAPLSALRLDGEHRYWLDGRELISVTTALKEAGLIDTAFFTDAAADRGTYVHAACDLVDVDDLGSVEPSCAGYVAAYERFMADARPTWVQRERAVCDPLQGYAGTLDRAGLLNHKWIVLDIKTGGPMPWHGLQLAAYARLAISREGLKPARFDLYLSDDGTYRLEPQTNRSDEALFFAALAVAQFRRTHGYRSR
jgi:hypothetical protein